MPFPVGVQTVTVTAGASGYRSLDGDAYTGTLKFTPSVSRVTSATHGVIALGPVNVTLSASGTFTETLLATDASGFSPSGWTYRVDEEFTNAPGRSYNISIPASTASVALPDLAPVDSATGSHTDAVDPHGDRAYTDTVAATKVTKAATSTDNAIARFDGTTGAAIQNSTVTIDDAGAVTVAGAATFNSTVDLNGHAHVHDILVGIGTTTSQIVFAVRDDGDSTRRLRISAGGVIDLSDGTTPPDTNLYRSAANTLRTDDSLQVGTNLTVSGSTAFAGYPTGPGTAPTSGAELVDKTYTDAQIAALSALTQLKVKTADEPRQSTTTVSDDGHLFASLEANSVYRFTGMLLFDGPEAADAKISFTAPAGATGGWSPVAGTLGTTTPDGAAQLKMAGRQFGAEVDVGVMASSATLAGLMVLPHGIVVTGATAGTLQLQWAQSTSNATPVNLKAGSTLEVVKVSGSGPSASGINLDFPRNYPSDQGLLAWTYDPDMAGHVTAQSAAGVGGRVTLTKLILRKQITVTNIWLGLSGVDTAATLTNCYVGIYDSNGTLRGATADLSATFINAANAKAIPLPLTTPFTAGPGEYFIAMLLNGTWTTNTLHFKCSGAGISVNANLAAPSLRYSNMLTGQTSLPASLDLTQQSTSIINTGWASQWYGVS